MKWLEMRLDMERHLKVYYRDTSAKMYLHNAAAEVPDKINDNTPGEFLHTGVFFERSLYESKSII
jgi:hypothetical protein